MAIRVRDATPDDLPAVQAIYAREVETGTASFELLPPSIQEIRQRHAGLRERGFPYLAALLADRLAGYAYAGPFRPRPAYRWTVENSVYVADWARGHGVGARLLEALVARCTRLGFRQMIAVIGDSANIASIELHRRAGFVHAGVEKSVGFKFGRWLDTVQMQRPLGAGDTEPPDSMTTE